MPRAAHDRVDGRAYAPFMMRAADAAHYLGMSPSAFLERVKEGKIPAPRRDGRMALWVRLELEDAARSLPVDGEDDAKEGDDEWLARIGS